MLWNPNKSYTHDPFDLEDELEKAIEEVAVPLFGPNRIYLETKKMIGKRGRTRNIPDGYLLDLTSSKDPKLYVVENELSKHDPLKHIAVQILEFSLSYETTPHKVKEIVKKALHKKKPAWELCAGYASDNGFENIDYLLERIIYAKDSFNALVIIDQIPDELETVLHSRFKFPVEIVSLQRYASGDGEKLYDFSPFLGDVDAASTTSPGKSGGPTIDPSEIDTIVVPARKEGFEDVFIGEDCWYSIRIHSSMLSKIKYVAAYQAAPISAITHIAPVDRIEQWKDTSKYILYFDAPAKKIQSIKLVSKGRVKAPQSPRYTAKHLLDAAKDMDGVF